MSSLLLGLSVGLAARPPQETAGAANQKRNEIPAIYRWLEYGSHVYRIVAYKILLFMKKAANSIEFTARMLKY